MLGPRLRLRTLLLLVALVGLVLGATIMGRRAVVYRRIAAKQANLARAYRAIAAANNAKAAALARAAREDEATRSIEQARYNGRQAAYRVALARKYEWFARNPLAVARAGPAPARLMLYGPGPPQGRGGGLTVTGVGTRANGPPWRPYRPLHVDVHH